MIDSFDESKSRIFFFPNLSNTMKSKHIHYTHTTLKVDLSFIKFLWNKIHCIIVSSVSMVASNAKSFNCQFYLFFYCCVLSVTEESRHDTNHKFTLNRRSTPSSHFIGRRWRADKSLVFFPNAQYPVERK